MSTPWPQSPRASRCLSLSGGQWVALGHQSPGSWKRGKSQKTDVRRLRSLPGQWYGGWTSGVQLPQSQQSKQLSAAFQGPRGVCPVRRAAPGAGCRRRPAEPRPLTSGHRPETSVAEGHLCNLSARKVKDQESLKATGKLSEPHSSKHTPFPPQQVQGLTNTPGPTQLFFGERSSRWQSQNTSYH